MTCAYCVERQPVLDIRQLHIGDHIEFGRYSHIKKFLNLINQNKPFQKHIRFGYMYFHHAIVTDIDHFERKLKLVEFSNDETCLATFYRSFTKPTIQEKQISFDDKYDHMYRVIHKNLGRYPPSPQEIVKNARNMVRFASQEKYHVFLNNCEHLVNLCITKRRVSIQVKEVERSIFSLLSNSPKWLKILMCKIGVLFQKFLIKFEKVLHTLPGKKLISAFSFMKHFLSRWLGSMFAIAIIFMAKDIFQFYKAWKNDSFCPLCFQGWVFKSCCRLLSMLPSTICFFLCAIGVVFTGFLTYKALVGNQKRYTKLQTLNKVRSGDVITFNLYMPFSIHDAIVVKCIPRFSAGNMRRLKESLTSMSESEVEKLFISTINDFYRDTTNEEYRSFRYLRIYVQDVPRSGESRSLTPGLEIHQEIDALNENSTSRILKKYLSGWRRVAGPIKDEENIPKVLMVVEDELLKLYHDFDGKYDVEIVHYDLERGLRFPDFLLDSARVVKFETKTLLLRTQHNVYKRDANISAAYRYKPEEIVQKALEKIGERNWKLLNLWSSDLADECTLVDPKLYISRGYRFARIVHGHCFDLLYKKAKKKAGAELLEYLLQTFFGSLFYT